jgi:hypothetical protein
VVLQLPKTYFVILSWPSLQWPQYQTFKWMLLTFQHISYQCACTWKCALVFTSPSLLPILLDPSQTLIPILSSFRDFFFVTTIHFVSIYWSWYWLGTYLDLPYIMCYQFLFTYHPNYIINAEAGVKYKPFLVWIPYHAYWLTGRASVWIAILLFLKHPHMSADTPCQCHIYWEI